MGGIYDGECLVDRRALEQQDLSHLRENQSRSTAAFNMRQVKR
jgi:hypothetical protein